MFRRKTVAGYKWVKSSGMDLWEAVVLDRDGTPEQIIVRTDNRLRGSDPWLWERLHPVVEENLRGCGGFSSAREAMISAVEWISMRKPTLQAERERLELESRKKWRGSVGKGPLVYAESYDELLECLRKQYPKAQSSKYKIQQRSALGWGVSNDVEKGSDMYEPSKMDLHEVSYRITSNFGNPSKVSWQDLMLISDLHHTYISDSQHALPREVFSLLRAVDSIVAHVAAERGKALHR